MITLFVEIFFILFGVRNYYDQNKIMIWTGVFDFVIGILLVIKFFLDTKI